MEAQREFLRSTTIIDATYAHGEPGYATGFFYSPTDRYPHIGDEQDWRTLHSTWVVTNRHVLLPRTDGASTTNPALQVVFRTRRVVGDQIVWNHHPIDSTDLGVRARFHPDKRVDLAAIEVTDLLGSMAQDFSPWVFGPVTSHELLGGDNPIAVETGTSVLVAGFPYRFHHEELLFPIVKSGIIASAWGMNWRDVPCFLIDARLFPGSSGSLVATTPERFAVHDGIISFAPRPQVSLLGVYSGAFRVPQSLRPDDPLDLGVVWYAESIHEVIGGGVGFAEATSP